MRYSERKFWFLYSFTESLLALDCITTVIILGVCGGVELNPIVLAGGLFNITAYKLAAGAFVGIVSYKAKFLWLLYGLVIVFTCVVAWNAANILMVL